MKKVLILVASNSETSINRELGTYVAKQLQAKIELLDMLAFDELPLYSARRQDEGFPDAVLKFFEQLKQFDGVVIVSPEHNGSVPAVFKNLIDWTSRLDMKFLGQKPVMLLSTSPGKNGGSTNLATLASLVPWWGARLIGRLSIGSYFEKMNRETQSLEPETALALKTLTTQFENILTSIPIETLSVA
mgnify:CR=1 FL=1